MDYLKVAIIIIGFAIFFKIVQIIIEKIRKK